MAHIALVTCQSPYQLLVTTRGHAPCPLVICRQPGAESLLQSGKAVGCHPPPCLARRHRENRNAIDTFGKPYARGGAVLPGKFVRVLKIEGKCSCLRAKVAHISGYLPPGTAAPLTILLLQTEEHYLARVNKRHIRPIVRRADSDILGVREY